GPARGRRSWGGQRCQAGIPAAGLPKLSDSQREDLVRAHIAEDIARDRALFATLPEDPDSKPTRPQRKEAMRAVPAGEVRRRAADYRDQRRRERHEVKRPTGRDRQPPPR